MNPDKIKSVILWSVISAAFIGPGTITTAITAGASFHLSLLWAVVFATIACIMLQEVSARVIISSGLTFGECIDKKFRLGWIKWLVAFPVLLGCAAYEAGNILGAVSGLALLFPGDVRLFTIVITLVAGWILWRGGSKLISNVMMVLVGIMAIAFAVLAWRVQFSAGELIKASLIPSLPAGSEWIALGLVGTTIVPYNIFIGSAISKGSTIPLMRIGLIVSVLIGGIITACILLAGTVAGSFTSFGTLAETLQNDVGIWGAYALGVGLFAAGFSSAITSPYAASLIAGTVLGTKKNSVIRLVWILVLLTGFIFGISQVKPIPVILTVQALNGLVLPLLTWFLILLVNDKNLVPVQHQHRWWYNGVLLLIFVLTLFIGLNNVDKAIVSAFDLDSGNLMFVGIVSLLAVGTLVTQLVKKRA
ncbi:MAG TPA: Nramp family divalent metal transporter [Cyclobacteriaceae bacterium]|nr:Nramp family divalent metal transporter [Cytophagales bacterium]HRE67482.1 Nramp family divalent metal transporter [Cyclobacteriaceae bacterium]HRF33505.1 Nramp family divalent metal transporter [Cyclobacteriaceae bacterium]